VQHCVPHTPSVGGSIAPVTMGGQAQVVTFYLDALLGFGEKSAIVLVLHLSPDNPCVQDSLTQLSAEFAGERSQGRFSVLRRFAISADNQPLSSISSADDAKAVSAFARDLLTETKQTGQPLQLCIAGGPCLLALTLTSAVILQCDRRDRLWCLHTTRPFIEKAHDGVIRHTPPEAGGRIVPVPIAPWDACSPALQAPGFSTGSSALSVSPAEAACGAIVWNHFTDRKRDVSCVLAGSTLSQWYYAI
jgi:hypothetical protein